VLLSRPGAPLRRRLVDPPEIAEETCHRQGRCAGAIDIVTANACDDDAAGSLQRDFVRIQRCARIVDSQFPEQLARALLSPGAVITAVTWTDTQLTSRQRRLDRALDVTVDGERRFEHAELQAEMQADVPFRVYEYHALFALALAAETPAGTAVPRIRSTVVLLSGRERSWPEHGEYRTSPDGEPFSGVSYRIDAVYQRTVAELAARSSPLWMIFAPLAVDAGPRADEGGGGPAAGRDFGELAAALTVVSAKDKRQRGLREAILGLLSKEDVMQSSVFQMGRQDGKKEGHEEAVVRLYEKRLGRPLDDAERATLVHRLARLGYDHLVDVRDELSGDALAAWLHNQDAA
jgi:hypothetical protein